MRGILAGTLVLAALAAPAHAGQIDFVGKVTSPAIVGMSRRPLGDPNFVALSPLLYDGQNGAAVTVLDIGGLTITRVATSRYEMVRNFGRKDPQLRLAVPPGGELVSYRPGRAGLFLQEYVFGGPSRHWYAEIDGHGRVVRSVELGDTVKDQYMEFAGTDGQNGESWFVVYDLNQAILRRVDLKTLAVSDPITVQRGARGRTTGYEEQLFIHSAPDFSRFALVEYFEDGLGMKPGQVYILDPAQRTYFGVNAPSTAYGVALAPGGQYAYLGSCQHGTVMRLDLATHKIDKKIGGPVFLHHLAISPDGRSLFALASSKKYTVYD